MLGNVRLIDPLNGANAAIGNMRDLFGHKCNAIHHWANLPQEEQEEEEREGEEEEEEVEKVNLN